MGVMIFLLIVQVVILGITLYLIVDFNRSNKPNQSNRRPKCKCPDVSQCDTWCIAKENFSKWH